MLLIRKDKETKGSQKRVCRLVRMKGQTKSLKKKIVTIEDNVIKKLPGKRY